MAFCLRSSTRPSPHPPDSDRRRNAAMDSVALYHNAGGEAIAPNRPDRPIPDQLSRDFSLRVWPKMPGVGGRWSKGSCPAAKVRDRPKVILYRVGSRHSDHVRVTCHR